MWVQLCGESVHGACVFGYLVVIIEFAWSINTFDKSCHSNDYIINNGIYVVQEWHSAVKQWCVHYTEYKNQATLSLMMTWWVGYICYMNECENTTLILFILLNIHLGNINKVFISRWIFQFASCSTAMFSRLGLVKKTHSHFNIYCSLPGSVWWRTMDLHEYSKCSQLHTPVSPTEGHQGTTAVHVVQCSLTVLEW